VHAGPVHRGVGRTGLALLVTVLALVGCSPNPEDVAACRDWYRENTQARSDHGYPGRAGFTPKMTARWNELYARSTRLDGAASVEDCEGPLSDMIAEVTNLEAVLYKIDDYDVALMTRRTEADLDRRAEKNGVSYATDYVLITLLRTMRERGADAEKALAPLVADVDVTKPGAERAAAMVALYNAAASNAAFADFKEALESIQNYEFDDEAN